LKPKKEYIQFSRVFSLEILILTKILDNIITGPRYVGKEDQKFKNNCNEDILENNKDCNKIVLTQCSGEISKEGICVYYALL
jgi:hypothetical protein